MTSFKLLCDSCGLSLGEAAAYLRVRRDTTKNWSSGKARVPDGVVRQMLGLMSRQKLAAEETARLILSKPEPESIELGLGDDYEAQSLGWPCVGAHAGVLRRVIEMLPEDVAVRVVIVPRGATLATAAAIEAN